ncbi:hypothetical protein [Hymenobacter terricola]|uniref:hypothetical protein n=1 Tax=Hymenobacter terricola TaxID=2819236 RepID=UPI001B311EFE|nr:hypothetical protein [Hymenobacter terricola]
MNLSTLFRPRWPHLYLLLLLATFFLVEPGARAQTTPAWTSVQRSISSGTGSGSGGRHIVIGADGSQYVTGAYAGGSLTLGTATLAGAGGRYTFLAKYSAAGALIWNKIIPGISSSHIAVDAAGNVYMTGFFTTPIALGTTTLTLAAINNYDSYLVKYDAQGVQQWVRQGNGNGISTGGIAIDGAGNVVIAGDTEGAVSFGGPPTPVGGPRPDIFYCKLSPAGAVLQAKLVTTGSFIIVNSLALDTAGNAFIAAELNGTATFGTTTVVGTGSTDILLCKLDAAGNFVWARRDGGTGTNGVYSSALSVAVDAGGNPVVAGAYGTSTNSQPYVALYTTQGTQVWARQVTNGTMYSAANSVAYDGRGGYLVTGMFENSALFGTIPLTAAGRHLFVARYDSQGNAVWADQAAGTSSTDTSTGNFIVADASGNGFVVGSATGNAAFGALATTPGTSTASSDIVIAKFTVGNVLTPTRPTVPAAVLACYPNPASGHTTLLLPAGGGQLVVLDALGRSVQQQALPATAGEYAVSLAGLTPGLYQLLTMLGNGQTARIQLGVQ